MPTDREGQGYRNDNGGAFAQSSDSRLRAWLTSWDMENSFSLITPKDILVGNGRVSSPDRYIVRIGKEDRPLVAFGYKHSMKDRRKEDFWDAEGFHRLYPDVPWVQLTMCESMRAKKLKGKKVLAKPRKVKNPLTESEKIERTCYRFQVQSDGHWTLIASLMVPDMLDRLSEWIGEHLQGILEQEGQAAKSVRAAEPPSSAPIMVQSAQCLPEPVGQLSLQAVIEVPQVLGGDSSPYPGHVLGLVREPEPRVH